MRSYNTVGRDSMTGPNLCENERIAGCLFFPIPLSEIINLLMLGGLVNYVLGPGPEYKSTAASLHALSAKTLDGKEVSLKDLCENKVCLVVNVASDCGYTDSGYKALNSLYNKYKSQGFEILAFPCNQFGGQEPGSQEAVKACAVGKYKSEFRVMEKASVKGDDVHPVYSYLLSKFPGAIRWNFGAKFIVDRNGIPRARVGQGDWIQVEKEITALLDKR